MSAHSHFVLVADAEFIKSGFGISVNALGKSFFVTDKNGAVINNVENALPAPATVDSKQMHVK